MRGLGQTLKDFAPPEWRWPLLLSAAVVVTLAINPVGFIGGRWDDYQYLAAARCWVEHGPCLPRDHWQGRWPLIAPLAAIIGLLGESRLTLALIPSAAYLACLALIVACGNRLFGHSVGWIAACLAAVTPIFAIQALDPNVEGIELAFILAGFFALARMRDGPGKLWPILAGVCFAMAVQTRETAVIVLPFAAAAAWCWTPRGQRIPLLWALAGFVAPFLVEAAVFAYTTGDPMWRRNLSIAHTQVASTELIGPPDHRGLPFFNSSYIARWNHEPGVQLHWSVDGLLNLLINPKAGLSLLLAPMLLFAYRGRFPFAERRRGAMLLVGALLYACGLIYALAIDPKARMMFVPITASILVLAFVIARLALDPSRGIARLVVIVYAICGLSVVAAEPRLFYAEQSARGWILARAGEVKTVEDTRRHLTLLPEAAALPGAKAQARFLLLRVAGSCQRWIANARLEHHAMRVTEQEPLSLVGYVLPGVGGSLCLFEYGLPSSSRSN